MIARSRSRMRAGDGHRACRKHQQEFLAAEATEPVELRMLANTLMPNVLSTSSPVGWP